MAKPIIYALIFLLIPIQLIAQNYGKVKKDTLKRVTAKGKPFNFFKDEILNRNGSYSIQLQNGDSIDVGSKNPEMKKAENPKILSESLLNKIIKKQNVFLEDGKLHKGYLFDFNHSELELNEKEIRIADYLDVWVRLKKNGENAKTMYPYNSSGLVFFYKPVKNFSDPYIRIIVPGYVTAFIDKDSIESIPNAYDSKVFKKLNLIVDEKQQSVVYNNETGKVYMFNKGSFENTKELKDGVYKINGEKEELILEKGKVTTKAIPPPKNPIKPWIIVIASIFSIAIILLLIFKKYFQKLFKSKVDNGNDNGNDNDNNDDGNREGTVSETTKESDITTSNGISPETLENLKNDISESITETQTGIQTQIEEKHKVIITEIHELKEKIESKNNDEITTLKSTNETLILEKENLNEKVNDLSSANKKLKRFDGEALFIDNYEKLTNKLIPFFDTIKQLEYKLISDINSQKNYTVKQFQALVFSKYLYHKVTDDFKDWDTILRTLQTNNGLITDKTILLQIKDKTSTHEQLQGIEWIVVNDVIVPKVDRLLILLEEFRNTLKITGVETELSSTKIEQNKIGIIEKMKSLFDIQIENIELFSDSSSYNLEFSQDNPSYEINMKNLKIGAIKEIKTYGMKLKEKTIKTKVIE